MTIHKTLKIEIEKQLKKEEQSEIVGKRLTDWIEELSVGIDSNRRTKEWISLVLKDIKIKDHDEN